MIINRARNTPRVSKSAASTTDELIGFSSNLLGLRRYRAASPHRKYTIPGIERTINRVAVNDVEAVDGEYVGKYVRPWVGRYVRKPVALGLFEGRMVRGNEGTIEDEYDGSSVNVYKDALEGA